MKHTYTHPKFTVSEIRLIYLSAGPEASGSIESTEAKEPNSVIEVRDNIAKLQAIIDDQATIDDPNMHQVKRQAKEAKAELETKIKTETALTEEMASIIERNNGNKETLEQTKNRLIADLNTKATQLFDKIQLAIQQGNPTYTDAIQLNKAIETISSARNNVARNKDTHAFAGGLSWATVQYNRVAAQKGLPEAESINPDAFIAEQQQSRQEFVVGSQAAAPESVATNIEGIRPPQERIDSGLSAIEDFEYEAQEALKNGDLQKAEDYYNEIIRTAGKIENIARENNINVDSKRSIGIEGLAAIDAIKNPIDYNQKFADIQTQLADSTLRKDPEGALRKLETVQNELAQYETADGFDRAQLESANRDVQNLREDLQEIQTLIAEKQTLENEYLATVTGKTKETITNADIQNAITIIEQLQTIDSNLQSLGGPIAEPTKNGLRLANANSLLNQRQAEEMLAKKEASPIKPQETFAVQMEKPAEVSVSPTRVEASRQSPATETITVSPDAVVKVKFDTFANEQVFTPKTSSMGNGVTGSNEYQIVRNGDQVTINSALPFTYEVEDETANVMAGEPIQKADNIG